MKKIVIGNWKMHPDSPGRAIILAQKIEHALRAVFNANVEVVIAPPMPFLLPVGAALERLRLASQDVFWADCGAYTGEVSWRHLKHMGVHYVILGHSERRMNLGETDDMVHKKVAAVLASGLTAIVCVGEDERIGNDIPAIVGEQVRSALRGIKKAWLARLIIAYEPVWAISTSGTDTGSESRQDTPEDMFRARLAIESVVADIFDPAGARSVRIIYGGSVRADTVSAILASGRMDGVLVGAASLKPAEFAKIVRLASEIE